MKKKPLSANDAYTLFQRGYCGIYALALFDLSGDRLKLGMIRGQRPEEDDEDEILEANIHAFVFHPHNSRLCLDSEGTQDIEKLMNIWMEEHSNHIYVDIEEFTSREDFLLALSETGTEMDQGIYQQAIEHIRSNDVVMEFLKPFLKS